MNKESYNKIAQKWTTLRSKSFVSELVKDFASKTRQHGKILEIGCGSGFLTKYLCEEGFQVDGIDISQKMIEIAKAQNIYSANFTVCDFFEYRTNKKYDGVIAWDSFFRFPKERQKDIYSIAGKLLNPGGYLLFTHGDANDEHTDKMLGETFYYSCIPKNDLVKTLEENGFDVEYAYKNYIEKEQHRDLIILAKKKE